jgi:hypothetical protein
VPSELKKFNRQAAKIAKKKNLIFVLAILAAWRLNQP